MTRKGLRAMATVMAVMLAAVLGGCAGNGGNTDFSPTLK